MYSKTIAFVALFLFSSATAQREFLRRFRVVSRPNEIYFIKSVPRDLTIVDPNGQIDTSSLSGSVTIQNGKTYRAQDVVIEDNGELMSADGKLALDRYSQECTITEGSGAVAERTICDYSLCAVGKDLLDNCIFLRSGGNVSADTEATVIGGTGKFNQLEGKALITTESSPADNGPDSFIPGATVTQIGIDAVFGKAKN